MYLNLPIHMCEGVDLHGLNSRPILGVDNRLPKRDPLEALCVIPNLRSQQASRDLECLIGNSLDTPRLLAKEQISILVSAGPRVFAILP